MNQKEFEEQYKILLNSYIKIGPTTFDAVKMRDAFGTLLSACITMAGIKVVNEVTDDFIEHDREIDALDMSPERVNEKIREIFNESLDKCFTDDTYFSYFYDLLMKTKTKK